MSFVELGTNLDDVKDKEVVPEGEYGLVIEDAKYTVKEGKHNVNVRLSVEGMPMARSVFHNISLPNAEDEAGKRETKLLFLKRFLEKFKIPFSGNGFNEEDFPGKFAKCKLILDEYNGQINNKIKM